MPNDPFDRVALAIGVAIFAGLVGAAALDGWMTGVVDGPARGGHTAYASNPQLFVLLAVMYSCICLGGAALAFMLIKHRNDP